MAIKIHTQGQVKVEGNTLTNSFEGTLTVELKNADTTPIGTTWDRPIELGRGWTWTGSAYYDPSDTAQAALKTGFTTGDATFTSVDIWEDASHYYGGSALLTNATITKSVGNPDRLNVSFKGLAACAYT